MTRRTHGYGYVPDRPSYRKKKFAALAGKVATYPDAWSLSEFRPPIFDQNGVGSCTAHAKAAALLTSAAAAGQPLPFTPSPKFIYKIALSLDRRPTPGGSYPPLADTGAEPGQIERVIQQWGLIPMGPIAPDGRYSDLSLEDLGSEVDFGALEKASHELVMGDYAIESAGPRLFSDCKLALSLGHAVNVGFYADGAFEDWSPGKAPIPAPNERDTSGGWHYAYLIGYEPGRARLVNSWGDWGDRGEAWVSPAFVAACVGVYATAVHEVRT